MPAILACPAGVDISGGVGDTRVVVGDSDVKDEEAGDSEVVVVVLADGGIKVVLISLTVVVGVSTVVVLTDWPPKKPCLENS